jgi:alginate O-acetyltransferase complex protein AlgI
MFAGMAGRNGLGISSAYAAAIRPTEVATIVLGVIVVYAPLLAFRFARGWRTVRFGLHYSALGLFIVSCWTLQGRTVVPFLYFKF